MMALLTQAEGTSVITEKPIFENRFMHAKELARMGADIVMKGPTAVVRGPSKLGGAPVMATKSARQHGTDYRRPRRQQDTTEAQAASHHLDRGYEALDLKLAQFGSARKSNACATTQKVLTLLL